MNKGTLFYKKLYILLFLASLGGFGYNFNLFVKSNLLNSSQGSVAGTRKEKTPLTVELRVNSKEIAEKVVSDLSSNKDIVLEKVTYIQESYSEDMLVDLSDGSKITEVSSLENSLMLGAIKALPKGETPSDSDILLIVTTK